MMIRLCLLSAIVCIGLSYDEKEYGDTYRMRMHRKAESIEVSGGVYPEGTVLWNRDDPVEEDSRRKVEIGYYVIYNVTQRDNGRYIMRDKDRKPVSTMVLDVKAHTRHFDRSTGESFTFNFLLEPKSCNVYFFPENNRQSGTQIVRQGQPLDDLDRTCLGFNVLRPCGLSNDYLEYSCRGRYELRDNNGDKAMDVFLTIEPPRPSEFKTSYIGYCISAFLSAFSCCCCLRRCCCGASSSDKDSPEIPDAEPAVHYNEYDAEPGPGSHQLNQLPYAPDDPLIHNPGPVDVPPSYSEVTASADVPAATVHSDAEPQFEVKGTTFSSALPLSSDSPSCNIYNSDKLNFL